MIFAIASGKGGTGKTLVATNLAHIASEQINVRLFDLDVEEPNDHLFLKFENQSTKTVKNMIPFVDESLCTHCGICSKICEYHAIITLAEQVMVFPELCHSCYGCLELCPENAISEGFKEIGQITTAVNGNLSLVSGRLRVSETATTALISRTQEILPGSDSLQIYDAPPGTSCPFIETAKRADFILLVAEPTPFGLHDMDLVVQTLRQLDKTMAVIINKSEPGNTLIEDYCIEKNIEVLARIPLRDDIARTYAAGDLIIDKIPGMRDLFAELLKRLINETETVRS